MKLQAALSLVGAFIGVVILFIRPDLLQLSFQYSEQSRGELNPSMVTGTPAALAPMMIPIFFGLVGFILGFVINKILSRGS